MTIRLMLFCLAYLILLASGCGLTPSCCKCLHGLAEDPEQPTISRLVFGPRLIPYQYERRNTENRSVDDSTPCDQAAAESKSSER